MPEHRILTAIIEREGDGYVALCPELDVASQGETVEQARANLAEAVQLFFETADPSEVERRFHGDVFITRFEVAVLRDPLILYVNNERQVVENARASTRSAGARFGRA